MLTASGELEGNRRTRLESMEPLRHAPRINQFLRLRATFDELRMRVLCVERIEAVEGGLESCIKSHRGPACLSVPRVARSPYNAARRSRS